MLSKHRPWLGQIALGAILCATAACAPQGSSSTVAAEATISALETRVGQLAAQVAVSPVPPPNVTSRPTTPPIVQPVAVQPARADVAEPDDESVALAPAEPTSTFVPPAPFATRTPRPLTAEDAAP